MVTEPEEEPPEAAEEGDKEASKEPAKESKSGILMTIVGLLAVTLVTAGAGGGIGIYLAGVIEATVAEKLKAPPENEPEIRYTGDMRLQQLEPVVVNLANPNDMWIRLETAIVFAQNDIPNPEVTGAEIRQDIVAYARTLPLSQLEGPSALQHLREDLNERASVRTGGKVSELIIETMVLQ